MKKLIILLAVLLLVACSDDGPVSKRNDAIGEVQEVIDAATEGKQTLDVEKELYINLLNGILNEFDAKYDEFDIEAGTNLYNLLHSIASVDIEVAKNMRDSVLEDVPEEYQEVYSEFADRIIEHEELFRHLDWSD